MQLFGSVGATDRRSETSDLTRGRRPGLGARDGPDAAQEIWAAVFRKLWQLEDGRKFKAWLRTLVYFHCVNHVKQRSRRQSREVYLDADDWLALSDVVADGADAIDELLERDELRRLVTACLDQMPADYGLMLRLRYISGLSYAEIVSLTGLPLSTVKWRLHDARRLFRDRLAGIAGSPDDTETERRRKHNGRDAGA